MNTITLTHENILLIFMICIFIGGIIWLFPDLNTNGDRDGVFLFIKVPIIIFVELVLIITYLFVG